ncbi:hypothetical protein PHYSODRAFT_328967 [Phytophthora sojae]|uniref:Uncharacterized protein n=1 Tax=Phytophthora sojae (strain P6497) TaxID=1094619 RepID=G4Z5C9_PHYSP|nr:hypothetical protein PHYSODRAFT_328967 [Phytophthora sojae]EGZ20914.1 hypothetical protein PHYSODRAFT_328967 [Phytophthora sojae]|eukprot:XP_009523631.1 hypothetical protein PHYSODRAFT_328967 [Phytophthora sojae]
MPPPKEKPPEEKKPSEGKPPKEKKPRKQRAKKPPKKRRARGTWRFDKPSPDAPSALDVLLAWLTTPGNSTRWRNGLQSKYDLCREILRGLKANGIDNPKRTVYRVYDQVRKYEAGYIQATADLMILEQMDAYLRGEASEEVQRLVRKSSLLYKELTPFFGEEVIGRKNLPVLVPETPEMKRAREVMAAAEAARLAAAAEIEKLTPSSDAAPTGRQAKKTPSSAGAAPAEAVKLAEKTAVPAVAANKSAVGTWKASVEKNRPMTVSGKKKQGGLQMVPAESKEQGAATTNVGGGDAKESNAPSADQVVIKVEQVPVVAGANAHSSVGVEADKKNAEREGVDLEAKLSSGAEESKDAGAKQQNTAPVQRSEGSVEKKNEGGADQEKKQDGNEAGGKNAQEKKAQDDDNESGDESPEEEVNDAAKVKRVVKRNKLYVSSDSEEDDGAVENWSKSDKGTSDRVEQMPLAQRDEVEDKQEEEDAEKVGGELTEYINPDKKPEADDSENERENPKQGEEEVDEQEENEEKADKTPEQDNAAAKESGADAESSSSESSSEDDELETEDARPAAQAVSDDEGESESESESQEDDDDDNDEDADMDEPVKEQSDPEVETPAQQRPARKRGSPAPSSPSAKRSRRGSTVTIDLERETFIERAKQEHTQRQELFELERAKVECELQAKRVQLAMQKSLARKRLLGAGVDRAEVDRVLPL